MLAQEGKITYGQALRGIYDRRHAFSNAHPFSAQTLGQGNAFTFRQGVLCVLHKTTIRVTDLNSSSYTIEFDVSLIARSLPGSSSAEPRFSLLYYCDGILSVYYERNERPNNGRILVINTLADTQEDKRLIKAISLESSYKLFVRHTKSFLYYGTYTGTGSHGHHEWEIRGVSLDSKRPLSPCAQPLQLEEFFGTDIGSTVAFEIHNGYFYALSNQTSFDVEELDWTSFYHCIRFPLDQPNIEALDINRRVYRRQHAEGPIHDSWTDLTIQIDECTNKPVIVESRREWQKASSRQLRTFYISEIKFKARSSTPSTDGSPFIGANDVPMLPEDDPFIELLDSTNRPNYAPPQPRFNWNFHPEFGVGCATARSFILARTKFRAYNYSCSSFIDLVEDERCCGNQSSDPCLRIRIGSRRIAPLGWTPGDQSWASKSQAALVDPPVPDDDVLYRHSTIKMWPPPAPNCPCSKRLHAILNPKVGQGLGNRSITAAVDERSLVYMIKPGRSYSADDNASGTIVLVNFHRNARGHSNSESNENSASPQKVAMEDPFPPTEWHWTPQSFAHCQKGECR